MVISSFIASSNDFSLCINFNNKFSTQLLSLRQILSQRQFCDRHASEFKDSSLNPSVDLFKRW